MMGRDTVCLSMCRSLKGKPVRGKLLALGRRPSVPDRSIGHLTPVLVEDGAATGAPGGRILMTKSHVVLYRRSLGSRLSAAFASSTRCRCAGTGIS
jgi:hypothetical protein